MSKFFQHSYALRDEPRVKILIDEMGFEGYGILMTIFEEIRKGGGSYPLDTLLGLSTRRTQAPKLRQVINRYGLFQVDEQRQVSLNGLNLAQPEPEDRRQLSLFPEEGNPS